MKVGRGWKTWRGGGRRRVEGNGIRGRARGRRRIRVSSTVAWKLKLHCVHLYNPKAASVGEST